MPRIETIISQKELRQRQQALEDAVLGRECDGCGECTKSHMKNKCNGTGRIGGWVEPAKRFDKDFDAMEELLVKSGWIFELFFGPDGVTASIWCNGAKVHGQSDDKAAALFAAVQKATERQ